MEVDERLTRLEAIVAEDKDFERLELKALRIFKFILGIVALAAASVWTFSEFAGFLIERFSSLKHSLGW